MLRVMWIAAVIACSGACSSRPPPAAPPVAAAPVADAAVPDAPPLDQDLPRLAQRSLAMYQDLAKALAASGEDCARAVARLHELAGRYREVTVANAKVLQDRRAKELKAALAPHSADFDAAAAAVMHSTTVSRCAQDPKFSQAFDELLAPP